MKNPIDTIVGFFNPVAGLQRAQARSALSVVNQKRDYDIARRGRSNTWKSVSTSAVDELSRGFQKAAAAGQELCRNNPHAQHAKLSWAASIVSKGIKCEIVSLTKNGKAAERVQDIFDDWANSLNCDFEGHHNFYGLQFLWAAIMVESGGVFIRKHVNNALNFPLQLQTIEHQYLDTSKQEDGKIRDGIQYNDLGQIEGYWILSNRNDLQGYKHLKPESKFYRVNEEIVYLYRKERGAQHVGITWFAQSGTLLDKLDVLMDAKVTQEQVAACLTAFITNPTGGGLGVEQDAKGTNDSPLVFEPGMVQNLKPGQEITFSKPPNANGSGKFSQEVRQDLAVGIGMPYAKFTGDYSQFNFASGRMAKLDFNELLDHVQDHVMIPKLNIIFSWFKDIAMLKGAKVDKIKCEWIIPPRSATDPSTELDMLKAEVRAGFKAPSTAVKEWNGKKLVDVMQLWQIDKQLFGKNPFDIDPSKFSLAGNQIDKNDTAAGVSNTDSNDEGNDE